MKISRDMCWPTCAVALLVCSQAQAGEEIITLHDGPGRELVATACAIIAAACRVARAHGERVAADTNPAEIAIVDAWYIGEVLRRVPEERLAPAVRVSCFRPSTRCVSSTPLACGR